MKVIEGSRLPIKNWATDLEPEAEMQVKNLANLPFVHSHVAVMPDAHAGRGSTVGTVIATKGAIIPAAVGVDIGCGMCAVRIPFKVEDLGGDEKLRDLRHSIERAVPTGRLGNKTITDRVRVAYESLGKMSDFALDKLDGDTHDKALLQLGSLGGGNHFIEICTEQNGDLWVMLHSGSRNIGKCLADLHVNKAKDLMKEYFISLPDPDLAYLVQNSNEFRAYLQDLMWAQHFAQANRNEMMVRVLEQVYRHIHGHIYGGTGLTQLEENLENLFRVDCHHNYTAIENHHGKNLFITRKGAVSARKGEYGIIPGSMGAKSFIVVGKGNPESFNSCSHGAGRKMSRTKARALFTAEDLARETQGVECPKTEGFVDEIPSSYKDIETVMRNQADLVEPIHELKQIICVKGST